MTAPKIQYHPLALRDQKEAVAHYLAQDLAGLARSLLDEIENVLKYLEKTPNAGRPLSPDIRAWPLRKFPYSIMYRVGPEGGIRVLAVAAQKRRPNYWHGRR